ncbi:type II toxin-antitoxin system VapC family toxin [Leptolyngbya sp. NIES-2104]|uniref:type II toxin-antitoxin system VapC family toxin n=1 Tax=Leptolyngbya sp. NIES-2104 TaxID=1552121 RepID=UPI0006EC748C|nr:PIN domain-containing protein [Leptolyngbya sp. NIES-2104]GAP93569.1 toxin 1, PIN domain [Leptolyngbya sp. NIES-2104]
MKVLFDTSVVIAAIVLVHPRHLECVPWLERVRTGEIQGVISMRSYAECFSTLTNLPLRPRISPAQAQRLITETLSSFEAIALTIEDYQVAIAQMVETGRSGGGVYDALIAQAALKAEVEILLTLNAKDFTRLGEAVSRLVQVPSY